MKIKRKADPRKGVNAFVLFPRMLEIVPHQMDRISSQQVTDPRFSTECLPRADMGPKSGSLRLPERVK